MTAGMPTHTSVDTRRCADRRADEPLLDEPLLDEPLLIVYFSSVSENTSRFVDKLGMRSMRIPLTGRDQPLSIDEPYVLICPTYGGGKHQSGSVGGGFVPKQVIRFLNDPHNRSLIRGVIAGGNSNFGEEFCLAGDIIAAKCKVPYLYRFELMGTAHDVERVRDGLAEFSRTVVSRTVDDHAVTV
ncbi:class Ib ribonucleoside-diphosphate reductase assembly flavoprotein NrdI [Gordonia jinhuaensis]|nr:class Ib ribonucleoside-diphosphate reductase assembly flavoprotein NrdI [Gordonia jinhuaensis]